MSFAACLIALSGACVLDPSNVQVESGISRQLAGDVRYFNGDQRYGGATLGTFGLVLEQPLARGFGYRLALVHTSLLNTTADRGEERYSLSITWRPFGGAR